MKTVGGIIGALLGLGFADYHNEHVSIWTGGYVFHPFGFFLLACVGAGLGILIGSKIGTAAK